MQNKSKLATFKQKGDIITFCLDLDTQTLSITINNIDYGVVFDNIIPDEGGYRFAFAMYGDIDAKFEFL